MGLNERKNHLMLLSLKPPRLSVKKTYQKLLRLLSIYKILFVSRQEILFQVPNVQKYLSFLTLFAGLVKFIVLWACTIYLSSMSVRWPAFWPPRDPGRPPGVVGSGLPLMAGVENPAAAGASGSGEGACRRGTPRVSAAARLKVTKEWHALFWLVSSVELILFPLHFVS